jgi:hypothetical protein
MFCCFEQSRVHKNRGQFFRTGAKPTIVSYNASAVKIYNGTGSLPSAF